MGHPDTFEAIRAAALKLLRAEGVTAVSVRRVAKEAGVAMGTLRYYFPTHEDLLETCLDGFHQPLGTLSEQTIELMRTTKDPRTVAANGVRAAFAMLASQPELQRLRFLTSVQRGELTERRRTHDRNPFFEKAAEALASRTKKTTIEMRLVVDSIMRLVGWYSACTDVEVGDITGEENIGLARRILCEHVVGVAVLQVFGPEDPSHENTSSET